MQYNFRDNAFWEECLYTSQGHGDWWADEDVIHIGEDLTIGSYWTAKNQANADLREWLTAELAALNDTGSEGLRKKNRFIWTANTVDLVELAWALHLAGCLNNGKCTLKEVMEWFEEEFGVKVGKYHITIQEIAQRKKTRTKFLDLLMEKLTEKMDSTL
jgi:hypothetical protein